MRMRSLGWGGWTATLAAALLGACGEPPPTGETATSASRDPRVQAAFETCLAQGREQLAADNPFAAPEILAMLGDATRESCTAAVLDTCEGAVEAPACRVVLDVYGS